MGTALLGTVSIPSRPKALSVSEACSSIKATDNQFLTDCLKKSKINDYDLLILQKYRYCTCMQKCTR